MDPRCREGTGMVHVQKQPPAHLRVVVETDPWRQEHLRGTVDADFRGQEGENQVDTFYDASELEVAAPMPMGVEQFEPMTVERNLTSGGETSVEDVEILPMVIRAGSW